MTNETKEDEIDKQLEEQLNPADQLKEFGLEKADINSPTWKKINDFLEERLRLLRLKNDDTTCNMTERETADTRGAIREVKNLMTLGEPAPSVERENEVQQY